MVMNGYCRICLTPLDDHENAELCKVGHSKRVKTVHFVAGICSYCQTPLDDHEFRKTGVVCKR
jgi:hypothetical protein